MSYITSLTRFHNDKTCRLLVDVFYFSFDLQAGGALCAVNQSLDCRSAHAQKSETVAGAGSESTSRLRTYQERASISVPMTNVVVF